MRCWRRFLPGLCVLLAACAGAPESPAGATAAASPSPATAAPVADVETNWSDLLSEGAAAHPWLRTLEDPELEQLVAESLQHNREPARASANLASAEQLAAQAGAALAAALDGVESEAGIGAGDMGRGFGVARNLQWEFEVWDRLGSIEAGAANASRVYRSDLEAARLSLVAQTAKAWLLAAESNLQLALSQQAVEIHRRALQVTVDRAATGAANNADVSAAEAGLQAARERQRLAIGALVEAMRSTAAIIGRYPTAELLELRETVPAPAPLAAGIPASRLERRPDLQAAARGVALAFDRPRAVRTTALPRLPLTGADGTASDALTGLLAADSDFFSHVVNFLAPDAQATFDAASAGQMSARQRAALENYTRLARQVLADVARRLAEDSWLRQRAALLAASAAQLARAIEAEQSRLDAGFEDPSSLLSLQIRAMHDRVRLVRTQYARLARRVDLYLALGGDIGR